MDPDIGVLLAPWHDFYALLATSAAILVGGFFVGLALHLDVLAREERSPLGSLIRLAGSLFLSVLFAALLLLMPNLSRVDAGWVLASVGLAGSVVPLLQASRQPAGAGPATIAVWLVPLLLNLGVVGLALLLAFGNTGVLGTAALLLAIMLAVAALGTWRVLLGLARGERDQTEATLEAARDRPLERQIRALVREQRAQNKRSREQEGRGPRG